MMGFGGFAAGLWLGSLIAPRAVRLSSTSGAKILVSLLVVFGTASVLAAAGRSVGSRFSGHLKRKRLGPLDGAVGGGVSALSTLLVVWLIAGMLASVPAEQISKGIHRSKIVASLNGALPPAPSVFSRMRRLLDAAGVPDVFAELEPAPGKDVALPPDPVVRAAVAVARRSTVKIVGSGCGGILTGSGFVAAPGTVVTNAHVVAGIKRPLVQDGKGSHPATTVLFDPETDVAVLRVSGLAGPVLRFKGSVPAGTGAAALGFPGGGQFRGVPAAVIDEITAVGRDIYSRKLVSRRVYRLKADIHPGNSGGPLVTVEGEVIGVIFSKSAFRPIAYALTAGEVGPRVESAKAAASADTGSCAA